MTKEGRREIKENARKNLCLKNVKILRKCSAKNLKAAVIKYGPKLMIMDVEGAEKELLTAKNIKYLRSTHLVIELHPWIVKNIKSLLSKRFKKTHQPIFIRTKPRSYFDVPKQRLSGWIFGRWWKELIDERRPGPMEWLVLRPFKEI